MDNQFQLNYVNYFDDVNYGTASYAYLWDRRTQVFHAGVTYINYGQFDGFDEAYLTVLTGGPAITRHFDLPLPPAALHAIG